MAMDGLSRLLLTVIDEYEKDTGYIVRIEAHPDGTVTWTDILPDGSTAGVTVIPEDDTTEPTTT